MKQSAEIAVLGAGLVGSLFSLYLAKREFFVDVFERRPDMRTEKISAGRSINLAVSTRGLNALRRVGLEEEVLKHAVPMRGRMIHARSGELTFQPYGKDDSEYINSISRAELNKLLMTEAERSGLVQIHFNYKALSMDLQQNIIHLTDGDGQEVELFSQIAFASDGSASSLRDSLMQLAGHKATSEELEYGYKELSIPGGAGGAFLMEKNALHIWPRNTYMLIALPNVDGSFTCTLFLPFTGDPSFEQLQTPEDVQRFFSDQFPDAAALIDDLKETFFANPTGHMVTVKCTPWNYQEKLLLLGDAAHAIVPFFGQGMNCGFEDLTVLDDCMQQHIDEGGKLYTDKRIKMQGRASRRAPEGGAGWWRVFNEFYNLRKANTDAIADLAVENFIEMRDKVADPQFQMAKSVEKILQQQFPNQYVSRYSLVTFSTVPYQFAMEAGLVADEILKELCNGLQSADKVDLQKAERLIKTKLTPMLKRHEEQLPVRSR